MRMTLATREVLIGLLSFDVEHGAYGRELLAVTGLPGGTVYPMLNRLRSAGLIQSGEEEGDATELGRPLRTYWRLTPDGVELARAEQALAEALPKAEEVRRGKKSGRPAVSW